MGGVCTHAHYIRRIFLGLKEHITNLWINTAYINNTGRRSNKLNADFPFNWKGKIMFVRTLHEYSKLHISLLVKHMLAFATHRRIHFIMKGHYISYSIIGLQNILIGVRRKGKERKKVLIFNDEAELFSWSECTGWLFPFITKTSIGFEPWESNVK